MDRERKLCDSPDVEHTPDSCVIDSPVDHTALRGRVQEMEGAGHQVSLPQGEGRNLGDLAQGAGSGLDPHPHALFLRGVGLPGVGTQSGRHRCRGR